MTILKLTQRMNMNATQENNIDDSSIFDTLTLPYELRMRGRLKAVTDNGRDVGLFLDRGPVIRDGDLLKADSGEVIQVFAADEPVATAYIENGLPLARLCYHLGNRHTPLAIGSDGKRDSNDNNDHNESDDPNEARFWVRFAPDHVLEELASLLGAKIVHHDAPFDPESGAYAQAGREQAHSHDHAHHHEHPHDHNHNTHRNHSHNHDHNAHYSHDHSHDHSDNQSHSADGHLNNHDH